MIKFAKLALISIFVCFSTFTIAETLEVDNEQKIIEKQDIKAIQLELTTINNELVGNKNDLEKIRSDQINYKIEKDLLKEIYSTSLNNINTGIAAALGLITLLGYLSLKSIKETKVEYQNELTQLKKLKSEFDLEFNRLAGKLTEFEEKVGQISKTNEDQDRRLKLLELIEKVSDLVRSRHYNWAQNHISIGLVSDPENVHLLQFKATCHGRLGQFQEFINTNKILLNIENVDIPKSTIALNILEGYAITNQKDEFNSLYAQYKDHVIKYASNGAIDTYLKVLLKVSSGELTDALEELKSYTKQLINTQPYKHLGEWSFDEVMIYANSIINEKSKNLLLHTIRYFNGEFNSEDFMRLLN
jgi:hypothetical protein